MVTDNVRFEDMNRAGKRQAIKYARLNRNMRKGERHTKPKRR